jgi:hypothetical protein
MFYLCLLAYIVVSNTSVVAVVVWLLDLQLPMQSVPITTDVVSSNLDQGVLPKTWVYSGAPEGSAIPASYKTSVMLFIESRRFGCCLFV